MKVRYLFIALVAVGAQPAIAATPAGPGETAVPSVRAQALQRVADAMAAEPGARAGANTREAVEAIKARIKAMKRPSLPAEAPDCAECPEKAPAPAHPDSASQVSNVDCIHCIEQPILA